MTTEWIARRLAVPAGTDLVVLPGLCEGDPQAVAAACGVATAKGPKDLREIPKYLGRDGGSRTGPGSGYGAWDIGILATKAEGELHQKIQLSCSVEDAGKLGNDVPFGT
jgi:hypothetical protein